MTHKPTGPFYCQSIDQIPHISFDETPEEDRLDGDDKTIAARLWTNTDPNYMINSVGYMIHKATGRQVVFYQCHLDLEFEHNRLKYEAAKKAVEALKE